jgi:hypothetical protein
MRDALASLPRPGPAAKLAAFLEKGALRKRAIAAASPLSTGQRRVQNTEPLSDANADDNALDNSGAESSGRPGGWGWKSQGGSYEQTSYARGAQGRARRPSSGTQYATSTGAAGMAAPPVKLAALLKGAAPKWLKMYRSGRPSPGAAQQVAQGMEPGTFRTVGHKRLDAPQRGVKAGAVPAKLARLLPC